MGIPISGVSQAPAASDAANAVVSGSLTSAAAAGVAGYFSVYGAFNFAIWGTFVGTVIIEKTYDGGTTWIPVYNIFSNNAVAFTAPGSLQLGECEKGVTYRAHCTQYTSGTANYRFSTNGLMAMSAGVSAL